MFKKSFNVCYYMLGVFQERTVLLVSSRKGREPREICYLTSIELMELWTPILHFWVTYQPGCNYF